MKYTIMVACALLAGSMQHAWGMEEEKNDKEPVTDTDLRASNGGIYVTNPNQGLQSLIQAFERTPDGFYVSPEAQQITPKIAAWKEAASKVSRDSLVTRSEAYEQMSLGLQAGYLAQEINVAIKLYLDNRRDEGKGNLD